MDLKTEVHDVNEPKNIMKFNQIEFNDVTFKYPFDDFNVLSNINLIINKGNRLNAFRFTFHADLKLAIIGAPETDGKGYPSPGSPHCLSPSLTHTHTHPYLYSPSHLDYFQQPETSLSIYTSDNLILFAIGMLLCCPGVKTIKHISKNVLNVCCEPNLFQMI